MQLIQYRVFTGTIAEIESAFNAWAASLIMGANVNSGPLTLIGERQTGVGANTEREYMKECICVLPARGNGIAVPAKVVPTRA